MKRSFYIIVALLALVSCSKEGLYSGSSSSPSQNPGELYMINLSQKLLPDYLLVLESSLAYDSYGYPSSSEYETGGKSLATQGVSWTVNSRKSVRGIKIQCLDSGTWKLEWEGEYRFYDNYDDYQYDGYPTKCTMTAEQQEKVNESGHYNWKVVFECYRTEREGYACEFHSAPSLVYTSGTAASLSWEECNGSATMLVTKNGEKVDLVRMDYLGTSTRYFRGL